MLLVSPSLSRAADYKAENKRQSQFRHGIIKRQGGIQQRGGSIDWDWDRAGVQNGWKRTHTHILPLFISQTFSSLG